ncbi:MAG: hypothetical protein K2X91_01460 [Thermoleophilia bacterium]|nr:hypothetical protein [Thermoleophilia bacterium]
MPAPAVPAGTTDRSRCYLRGWVAFGPGYWNGGLYTRADCAEMGRLFACLSGGPNPALVPKVKIGHDAEQQLAERLKASLGFPALGTVTGLRVAPDGLCAFDLELPAQIGALCNGGVFNDCSIELAPPLPDPQHPTRKLYPVLTALSLLGEEQPAVPLRNPMPLAVYADGTEVPPASDLTPLAQAMAQVARTFSARARPAQGRLDFNGRTFATAVLCFSAMHPLTPKGPPMTPEQTAALQAANFTPEQIAAMEAALANPDMPGDIATMSKKFAMDDQTPPYAKEMMSAFAKFASDCDKRFSAMEASVKKTDDAAQMAAKFSAQYEARVAADHAARVEAVVDQAIREGRVEPRDRAVHLSHGAKQSDTQKFSAGDHAGKTAFGVWRDELLARQPGALFRPEPALEEPTSDDEAEAIRRRFAKHMPALRK